VTGVVDEGLFLVVVEGRSSSRDVVVMHRALRQAVARLGAGGVPIRWCSAVLLTDECRCLCLVRAAHRADVVLARDTAALPTAAVHPVHRLTGDPDDTPVTLPTHPSDS
jgi:hypothetical protein